MPFSPMKVFCSGMPVSSRELRVREQVAVLAVDRQHVLRLQDVVAVEQLARGGVAGDVHLRVALVHDVGAELGEAVDHAVDGVLVAGDEARREDDGVALADLDLVVAVRHAREHGHRLALRAGRHVDDLVVGDVAGLLVVDEHALGHLEVAEVGGDGHVAHHAAAEERDAAAVGVRPRRAPAARGARGSRSSRRSRGAASAAMTSSSTGPMERSSGVKPGTSALVESTMNRSTPSSPSRANSRRSVRRPSSGSWSILKSPVCEHGAGAGLDRDGERVGDRVVDRDELEVERAELLVLALAHREACTAGCGAP